MILDGGIAGRGFGGQAGTAAPAGLQAVALAVHLEDVDVVREPVEEGSGEPLGAEHGRPLVERQVAGDQDRAPLVAAAEHLEQQLRPARRQRHVAELVHDPPAYSSLRHRLAVRESRGGGGWTTRSGWARARRSAPHTLAEAGPRPRRGGACRRAASGRRSCGCCAARTWSWSRASSG